MLSWRGNDAFVLEGISFQILFPESAKSDAIPERFSESTFLVAKSRSQLEQYVDLLAGLQPRNIVEIGIWTGGSTVLLSTLAKPAKYVAIDLEDNSTPSFGDWLRNGPLKDHVVAHFGVDQSDGATLRAIAAEEFHGEPLDLVIDDASHDLAPTRASFEALFPRLRPGGIYVIEDWDAQHQIEKALQNEIRSDPIARPRVEEQLRVLRASPETWQPLTRLLVQVTLASAYTDIIDDIRIRRNSVMIQRGHEDFHEDGFVISDFYLDLGRELLREDSEKTRTSN